MKRDPQALQAREHDVLVIGGGIAGAWTVWEAASRGLSAALVELEDFGQATSWSSLKTAHGGLRHLQRLDLAGFRESVRERRALLRVAPEIVKPLGFAISARRGVERLKFVLGGLVNDALSFDRNRGLRTDRRVSPSQLLTAREAEALCGPALAGAPAFLWHDAQITHTERLVMSLLHAAEGAGAVVINHCRIKSGEGGSGPFDLRIEDAHEGREIRVRARSIVNASGAQIEAVARLLGESCFRPPLIRGVNLVLGQSVGPPLGVGARDEGRFLFLVPWMGRSMVGTSYDDGQAPLASLTSELTKAAARAFPWAGRALEDITAVHVGHVPGSDGEPVYRSRLIQHRHPLVLSVLTAKYTTARATAERTIDLLGRALSKSLPASVSATHELPMAKPVAGSLAERLQWVMDHEMALSHHDAVRGRLLEGAFGEAVPQKIPGER